MVTTPASDVRTRLPSLTGVRFFPALAVFVCHAFIVAAATGRHGVPDWTVATGYTGVGFFFTLSGFVLTVSARTQDTVTGFWRRRLVKIYPNHLVSWAFALVFALWAGQTVTTSQLLPSAFLLNSWFANLTILRAINLPSWSLSVELFFYLTFPFVYRGIARIRPERLWWWFGGLVVAVFAAAVVSQTLLPAQPQLPGMHMTIWQNWFVYAFPLVRLFEFVIGIVTARIVLSGRWIPIPLWAAALLLAVGITVQVFLVGGVFSMVAPSTLPIALVIGALATADRSGRSTFFARQPWVWLGETSFALYMTHYLVLYYGQAAIGLDPWQSTGGAIGMTVAAFGVSIVVAGLLYTLVERPAVRRWSRPKASRPLQVQTQQTATVG